MGLYENIRKEHVSRLALRDPVVVRSDTTVRDAIEQMRARNLGCAIVVDDTRIPQGLFAESDLTKMLTTNPAAINDPITNHIRRDWPKVQLTDPISNVLDALESNNIRFLIVIDEQGQLAGLAGQKGLMEYIAEHFPGQVTVQRIGGNPYPTEREGA